MNVSIRAKNATKMPFVLIIVALAGCSANSITSNAKYVRVTNNEPGRECTFLGDVTGNQGNFLVGAWTSNSNLETGARNDLKNKASDMGGNVVAIITQRAGYSGSSYDGTGSSNQTNVTLAGNVYRCPQE